MIESNRNNTVHRPSQHDTSLVKQTSKHASRDFENLFASLGEAEAEAGNYTDEASNPEKLTHTIIEPKPQNTTTKEIKSHQDNSDEASDENKNLSEIGGIEINQNEVYSGGVYGPTNAALNPQATNTPTNTAEKSAPDTQNLIDQLYTLAKTLINKAEICIDKEHKGFSIAILDSFLKDTEIIVSNKDNMNTITIKPSSADQYQFLQKEKETLRKKIKENNNDVSIDILIEEP